MNNQIIIPELNNETIESMIYEIRGQRVMLDFELARIYGYETKRFNEQVKNNIEKFPERYRFQLTKEEVSCISRSKKSTTIMQTEGTKGGRVYLPYAFTEQGIYMLMTVLKGELATKQSIILIDTFKQMKDYIVETNNVISTNEILKLTNIVYDTRDRQDKTDKKIDNIIADVQSSFTICVKSDQFSTLNARISRTEDLNQGVFFKALIAAKRFAMSSLSVK